MIYLYGTLGRKATERNLKSEKFKVFVTYSTKTELGKIYTGVPMRGGETLGEHRGSPQTFVLLHLMPHINHIKGFVKNYEKLMT